MRMVKGYEKWGSKFGLVMDAYLKRLCFLVKLDVEKRAKNVSLLMCKPTGTSEIVGLSCCSLTDLTLI